ncbi:MAG: DUF5714 domain-containing protein [Methanocorpusculum sp.]|nr:DUF5714 domain-containing protein [Methanocorpusculum sp.]
MNEYAPCVVCGGKVTQGIEVYEAKCAVCGKDINTNYMCEKGHYVCNQCKIKVCKDEIKSICLKSKSTDPIEVAFLLMDSPVFKNIVGCRYYVIAALALYTVNRNLGGKFEDFDKTLENVIFRAMKCPTSLCKMGGICGIPIATGMTLPDCLNETDQQKIEAMIKYHGEISVAAVESEKYSGSRDCCNRNAIVSILAAVRFTSDYLWIDMNLPDRIVCKYSNNNPRCNKEQCRFYLGYRVHKSHI